MANTFIELNDTPSSFANQAGKFLVVTGDESNITFAEISGTSGEITFTNNTINLVSTGITAATYGNATHFPQITVDTYGRIQNIDLIEAVANGNVSVGNVTEAYKYITVAGETQLAADQAQDTLTIASGSGISLTTTASSDTLTISAVGGGGSASGDFSTTNLTIYTNETGDTGAGNITYISSSNTFVIGTGSNTLIIPTVTYTFPTLDGNSGQILKTYGNGTIYWDNNDEPDSQELAWDEANSNLSITGGNEITLTGISGNYNDSNVQTYLDAQGYSNVDNDNQTLTWDEANSNISISGGNEITITGLYSNVITQTYLDAQGYSNVDSDNQTLTWDEANSNISISGGNEITITGLYSNVITQAYLDDQGYSNVDSDNQTLTWDEANSNISISGGNEITLTGISGNYNDSNVQTYLDAQGYSNVDNDNQTLTWDEANSNISISGGNEITLTGISGNYNDSNVQTYLDAQGYSNTAAELTDLSVTTNSPSGNGSLSFNNVSGVFTFTPADIMSNSEVQAYIDDSGTVDGFEIGYRNIPQVSWSSNVTLALIDSGKHLYTTSGSNLSVTIPSNANVAFALGDSINLVNQSNSIMDINLEAGVSMYLAGNSTSDVRTLSEYGLVTVTKVGTDTWFITGVGVA